MEMNKPPRQDSGRGTPSRALHRTFPSTLFGAGLLSVYVGERLLEVGTASLVATVLGVGLVLVAMVSRIALAQRGVAEARRASVALLPLYAIGAIGLALYFLDSNLTYHVTGRTFAQHAPRASAMVAALWPALILAGFLPVLFVEMSLATMRRAPILDQGRVNAARNSGLGIAFALVFCFAVAYVASERDVKVDLSYFRTAKAGESTKAVVRALDKPVKVYLFFPPANEVREEVESYFADLTRQSKFLTVEHYDHALHPQKARELNVTGNGIIVVSRDTLKEQISMPLALEGARSQLRVLDQEVNKRIIGVTRGARVAYFTQGHEERTFEAVGDTDRRGTVKALKDMVTDQNFEPKELGMAQGLGTDVPADATVVFVIGPRKPFLKEEVDALIRYLDRKGRLFVALDPESSLTMEELLGPLALKYTPSTLAHDRIYWNRTYQKADRVNIATASFSSHSSVTSISRLGSRAPVIFAGAGFLDKDDKKAVGIVNVDFTVHADGATWNDKNGNLEPDSDEGRKAYELAAAVSRRNASALLPEEEGRAVVIADADAVSDILVRNNIGNAYLALDAIRWLAGEAQAAGVINNEEDVPVAHTRKQDVVWFYGSVFAAPLAVLGIGFLMTRRRRASKRAGKPGATPTPPPTSSSQEVSP
jgi:hypothetical protein